MKHFVYYKKLEDNRKKTGDKGEQKAFDFLLNTGYSVIDRNFRTKSGEIDIICKKDNILVFVEVKTLPKGNLELLSHVLNVRKQKRIINTAKCFLKNNRQYRDSYIRFDVIVLDMPGLPSVYHLENAFSELL